MSSEMQLLPFQRFAQEWKDKVASRISEDLELEAQFVEQQAAFEKLKTTQIAALDQSKEIESETAAKIESTEKRLAEQIAALQRRHQEELSAIEAWKDHKMVENEEKIREHKQNIDKENGELVVAKQRHKEALKHQRQLEDAQAMETSLKLLEEEGLRLHAPTPEKQINGDPMPPTPHKEGHPAIRPIAMNSSQSKKRRGRRSKGSIGVESMHLSSAVLTPSTSPLHQEVDLAIDELQGEGENPSSLKRHRLQDLPPIHISEDPERPSKALRSSKVFDLHSCGTKTTFY